MYCKKCGTEQKEGQKFCSKCGEPFVEGNEKPHVDEFKQYAQKAADEFKKIDWNEKKEQTSSFIKEFINNPNKIGLATKVVACLFTLWILIKTGFSVSLFGYILLAAIIYFAFKGIPKIKLEGLKAQYASTAVCLILMFLIAWGTTSDGSNNSSGGLFSSSSSREICITMKADFSQGYEDISGNYGIVHAYAGYFTDEIIIPQGKMWIFEKQEIEYPEKESTIFHPDVCYYGTVNGDVKPVIYNTYTQLREIPIFRGNDRIRIRVKSKAMGNGTRKQSMDAKVYFIEKNDDLQTSN